MRNFWPMSSLYRICMLTCAENASTLYLTIHTFNDPKEKAFWKHYWWPAFSSFPTMFFYLIQGNFAIWITFNLLSANASNLDRSKILSFGKGLSSLITEHDPIISKLTNFRLFQTGRLCRRQFQIWRKWQKLSNWVENTWKRKNCSSRAISPFPSVFKRLVSQGRQKVSLCGNGLTKWNFQTSPNSKHFQMTSS